MDKIAKKTIVDGMLAFKPSIRFTTTSSPTETVEAAINSSPKIAYFLHGCSISGLMNRYEVKAQYIHKDTKLSEMTGFCGSLSNCIAASSNLLRRIYFANVSPI